MKKNSLFFSFFFSAILFGQVGIGTTSPNQKAALEVSSSNKGIVAPHVELKTLSDKQTVPNPAEGILVYNTTVDTDQKLVEGYYSWFDNKWNLIGNENY